jgi:hypothetical protein
MAKKIIVAVVILIVVLIGAVYFLYSNLGPILKAAIEKYGSDATQSQVKVGSVSLSAWSGKGTISDLVVDNPKGFTAPHAFELGAVSIAIDTSTLTHNPIVVDEVTIAAPHVTYEQGPNGGNLQKLQQNVTHYAGGTASASSPTAQAPGPHPTATQPTGPRPAASSSGPAPTERKLIIDKLDVTGGEVTVAASMLQGRTLTTSLPPIHLTDIGKKEGGATPAQVAELVISAISQQAAQAGAAELQKSLGNGGGAAQQKIQKLQQSVPGVGTQLKGLLGK